MVAGIMVTGGGDCAERGVVAVRPATAEATEKVPITAFLFIFSVTLFKNYRKRTLKILRSEVFQWPPTAA